jgi:hypothetical protein
LGLTDLRILSPGRLRIRPKTKAEFGINNILIRVHARSKTCVSPLIIRGLCAISWFKKLARSCPLTRPYGLRSAMRNKSFSAFPKCLKCGSAFVKLWRGNQLRRISLTYDCGSHYLPYSPAVMVNCLLLEKCTDISRRRRGGF